MEKDKFYIKLTLGPEVALGKIVNEMMFVALFLLPFSCQWISTPFQ